jgi:hypothetical protein
MSLVEQEPVDTDQKTLRWRGDEWFPLVVVIVGVGIRIAPNIFYFVWGNDFGIYYYLSRSYFNLNSLISPPSSPWGIDGYQYFPITYLIVDAVSSLTSLPVLVSLKYAVPIIGGLTPLLIYYISRELQIVRSISFLSAMLLAVDPIQLFQTSQPNYLTTGHFFLLLSVLLFLKYHTRFEYFVPALLSSVALTLSHQLSSYIFLISLIGMVVSVHLYKGSWLKHTSKDILFTAFTGTFLLGYLIIRVPSSKYFLVSAANGLELISILILFCLVVISVYLILKVRGACCFLWRATERLRENRSSKKSLGDLLFLALAVTIIEISLMILILTGSYSFIGYESVLLSIPFAVLLGIAVIGTKNALIKGEIPEILGWTVAITISMLYSAITANKTLEVARQVEYLVEPFSIIAGTMLFSYLHGSYSTSSSPYRKILAPLQLYNGKISIPRKSRSLNSHYLHMGPFYKKSPLVLPSARATIVTVLISALLITLVWTSYSMPSLFVPSVNEGATPQDAGAIAYLNSFGNKDLSVATDHQLGILLYSYGFNSPFDKISVLWSSENWQKALWELEGENGSYPKIGYILIDTAMIKDGVWGFNGVNNPSQPPVRMSDNSFNKFFEEPFKLIFRDRSSDNLSTAYVFAVNISYVDNFRNIITSGTSTWNIGADFSYAQYYVPSPADVLIRKQIVGSVQRPSSSISHCGDPAVSYFDFIPTMRADPKYIEYTKIFPKPLPGTFIN